MRAEPPASTTGAGPERDFRFCASEAEPEGRKGTWTSEPPTRFRRPFSHGEDARPSAMAVGTGSRAVRRRARVRRLGLIRTRATGLSWNRRSVVGVVTAAWRIGGGRAARSVPGAENRQSFLADP